MMTDLLLLKSFLDDLVSQLYEIIQLCYHCCRVGIYGIGIGRSVELSFRVLNNTIQSAFVDFKVEKLYNSSKRLAEIAF